MDAVKAAEWYHSHLDAKIPIVVLQGGLSDSAEPIEAGSAGQILNPHDENSADDLLDALLNLGINSSAQPSHERRSNHPVEPAHKVCC